MLEELFASTGKRMDQTIEAIRRDLAQLRTGRASTAILEGVSVDYYGQKTPLHQVCKLSVPDPSLIVAQPFDPSLIGEIEKAILAADLGLNPSNDGKVVRIPIPPLTEERRKQLAKRVGQIAEEGRNAIRHIRRDANERIKKAEKDGELSQDDARRGLEKIQKLTDEHIKAIDDLAKAKEKELLEF
ncbi:MAG: ribosome recycling factor [Acidobacteria bacterium]|nr:MAG: ribosome recycling factor [Acidobacteriota bacterium]